MVVPNADLTTGPDWDSPLLENSLRTMEDDLNHTLFQWHRYNNASKTEDGDNSEERKIPESGSPQKPGQPGTGMQNKGNQREKFFGKPWRNRSKVIPNAGNSLWRPDPTEKFSWCSVGGRKVSLTPIEVGSLSEPERLALQQVALLKLRKQILKSHITIPKGSREKRTSSLKRALSLKSRLALGSDKDKDSAVFAIPLRKAVAQSATQDSNGNGKKSMSENESTSSETENQDTNPDGFIKFRRHSASSLNSHFPRGLSESGGRGTNGVREPPESPSWKSRLIDALTLLSSSASASCIIDKQATLSPVAPRVPPIVLHAIDHLECYGLHVLGIFRTGGSKKRMKQMRLQFDSGEKKEFTAEDNPHDVAALFKEYFRDLPEPLLTRELYSAFLETQGFEEVSQQVKALRLLCCLLPAPNRDTLNVLLGFLTKVVYYAEDRTDDMGVEIPGNKMNSRNLATLIGPNILHKVKSGHQNDYLVDDAVRANETKKIIDVVQDLIDHSKELCVISPEIHHHVFLYLLENEPEILDFLLRKKTPCRMSADEEDIYDFERPPRPKKQPTPPLSESPARERVRTRSAGDTERLGFSGFTHVGSLNSRPPPEYPHKNRRWKGNNTTPTVTTGAAIATWERSIINTPSTPSPVPPKRSSSKHINTEECSNAFKQRLYARQLAQPEDSIYRRQRTPPPPQRGLRRFASSNSSEPSSPALSSSFSHSSYSTPLSSPPSTPFYSAESSSSVSPAVSYLGSEGPILTDLTELLTEVENDLARERKRERLKSLGGTSMGFGVADWQRDKWLQWESITQKNSGKRDLEQETLV